MKPLAERATFTMRGYGATFGQSYPQSYPRLVPVTPSGRGRAGRRRHRGKRPQVGQQLPRSVGRDRLDAHALALLDVAAIEVRKGVGRHTASVARRRARRNPAAGRI